MHINYGTWTYFILTIAKKIFKIISPLYWHRHASIYKMTETMLNSYEPCNTILRLWRGTYDLAETGQLSPETIFFSGNPTAVQRKSGLEGPGRHGDTTSDRYRVNKKRLLADRDGKYSRNFASACRISIHIKLVRSWSATLPVLPVDKISSGLVLAARLHAVVFTSEHSCQHAPGLSEQSAPGL